MSRVLRYAGASNANLAANAAHAHAASYALSVHASEAVYSFIPKNACSTLRYSLAIANGAIEGPSQFNWIHANNNTFRASLAELARARYAFVVLRDPFLRLASCFLDKIVEQTPVAFKLHALMNYASSPHDLTFRTFVAELHSHLNDDEHWRPQIDYLVYKAYDDVFAFEDFPRVVSRLKEKIGFVVHDARALTKHGTDQYRPIKGDACVADLSAFDLLRLKRGGKSPQLRNFYDSALIDAVRRLFAEDLQIYRACCGRETAF